MDKNEGIIGFEDVKPILNVLTEEDANSFLQLKEELRDTWRKKQIFRTETEMRMSVLDEVKRPTDAAKYWQAVREQSSMFNSLVELSFDLRRNNVERLKIEKKLETADGFKAMSLQIDLDENLYRKASMEQVAHDRMREIQLWSNIKSELDNGTFDTTNPDTHQADSFIPYVKDRVAALGDNPEPSEKMNAYGLYNSMKRLHDGKGRLRKFDEIREIEQLQLKAAEKTKQLESKTEGRIE